MSGRIAVAVVASALSLVAATRTSNAQSLAVQSGVDPRAQRLFDLRRANLAQDEPQGYLLLSWGLSSLTTGAVLGASGLGGETSRWFGVNTALWGAINTAIAIPWVLSFARERRDSSAGLSRTGDVLVALHRDTVDRSRRQSLIYAINAAIDVLYVTGGAIAWWAGTQQAQGSFGNDFLVGTGVAAISQGAFLLVFDTVGWLLARERTHRLRTAFDAPAP